MSLLWKVKINSSNAVRFLFHLVILSCGPGRCPLSSLVCYLGLAYLVSIILFLLLAVGFPVFGLMAGPELLSFGQHRLLLVLVRHLVLFSLS